MTRVVQHTYEVIVTVIVIRNTLYIRLGGWHIPGYTLKLEIYIMFTYMLT